MTIVIKDNREETRKDAYPQELVYGQAYFCNKHQQAVFVDMEEKNIIYFDDGVVQEIEKLQYDRTFTPIRITLTIDHA